MFMPQQSLELKKGTTSIEKVDGIGMSQTMWRNTFFNPRAFNDLSNNMLHPSFTEGFVDLDITFQKGIGRDTATGFDIAMQNTTELSTVINDPCFMPLLFRMVIL